MSKKSNILMIYPTFPPTYWGLQYVTPLLGKKASMPPLGLLTIAALTPHDYPIRLIDLNCDPLNDEDIAWADMVCFSAMLPQKSSLFEVAKRCRTAGKLIVFGGPYPTMSPEECAQYADVLILNEGEITWPDFIGDWEDGTYKSIYTSTEKPDITKTPVPRFDLLKINDYITIPLQYSRGCPYLCEFCDIIVMFGRRPRTKSPEQMLNELEAVYKTGYRGTIFIVDDNFIGNKRDAKQLLTKLVDWNIAHDSPFTYGTEATVDLADQSELLDLMLKANFIWVFLGIETPVAESLKETLKIQNLKGSLVDKVEAIQRAGLQVFGGFIVGFDHDPEDIFDRQVSYIDEVAISHAMIGPIVALPGTPLFTRMENAGRLIKAAVGDEDRTVASGYTNIVTKIPMKQLLEGQIRMLQAIYTPESYFSRQLRALTRLPHPKGLINRLRRIIWLFTHTRITLGRPDPTSLTASLRQILASYAKIPIEFFFVSLKFAVRLLRKCPDQVPYLPWSVLMGYHFYRFTNEHAVPGLNLLLREAALSKSTILEPSHDLLGEELITIERSS
ncbi:MAG: DUF4070 domain-containing protein [Nitrospira sp.]|nr:DUF4070 domain-containing protein [Nitrospira sp.]